MLPAFRQWGNGGAELVSSWPEVTASGLGGVDSTSATSTSGNHEVFTGNFA